MSFFKLKDFQRQFLQQWQLALLLFKNNHVLSFFRRGSRRVAVLGGIVFGLFIAFSMCILILLLQRPSQQPVKVKDCYVRGFCLSGDVISRTFPDHFDGCIEDCLLHKDCKTISYSWNGKVCQLMKSCSDISRSNCPNCVTHNIVECPQRNICASNGQCHVNNFRLIHRGR